MALSYRSCLCRIRERVTDDLDSLFDKLTQYGETDCYPYHMPGHKRNPVGKLPGRLAAMDITEIDGFDDLHHPEGLLGELQQQAAELYGAEESYYLVGGSTCGILSAVSAALPEGGQILIARNCHSAIYHAAYLRRLSVSYLYPSIVRDYDICEAVTPKQVWQALEQNPSIGAVVVVSPTYEGRIADIYSIARVVHERGIPLIVDEAHGAHLGFHEAFAQNSCRLGADIVIHSVHKTLPSLTQTGLLHVNGNLVDRERLKRFLRIYQSSSPSYVLMAGIDNALGVVKEEGAARFRELVRNWREMMEGLQACRNLRILPDEPGRQDIGKLVISVSQIDLSARHLYDMLLQEYQLQLEMAAETYVLAMFTIGDRPEGFRRLTAALLEIDGRLDELRRPQLKSGVYREEDRTFSDNTATPRAEDGVFSDKVAIPLAEAWDRKAEKCPLEKCEGRYAGDFICLYPPGIPLVVPGEILTGGIIDRIYEYLKQGWPVRGIHKQADHYRVGVLV